MAKKIALKNCPFCTSKDNSVKNLSLWTILGSNRHHCISCEKCGCKGPIIDEENKKFALNIAAEAWNKRFQNFSFDLNQSND